MKSINQSNDKDAKMRLAGEMVNAIKKLQQLKALNPQVYDALNLDENLEALKRAALELSAEFTLIELGQPVLGGRV